MSVKVKKVGDQAAKFEKWLNNYHYDQGEVLAKELEKDFKDELRPTLRHASESGTYALADATIKTDSEISKENKGVSIVVHVIVVDPSGSPHPVWHILDQGRPQFVQKKTSPPIKERVGVRTFRNNLQAAPFPGYTGKKFVIRAGTTVSGIPARRWYQTAANHMRDNVNRAKGKYRLITYTGRTPKS